MNATQRKYALERAAEIFNVKKKELEKAYTDPIPALTTDGLVKGIKKGTIGMRKPTRTIHNYTDVSDIFLLPKGYQGDDRRMKKEFGPKIARLKNEYGRVKDEIMLGDAEEAVKLLNAFKAFS